MKFYELMLKSKGEAMKSIKVSRRDMLKIGLVGAGALALGAANADAAISAKEVKFDEEWDVVIIGSGFAGLASNPARCVT